MSEGEGRVVQQTLRSFLKWGKKRRGSGLLVATAAMATQWHAPRVAASSGLGETALVSIGTCNSHVTPTQTHSATTAANAAATLPATSMLVRSARDSSVRFPTANNNVQQVRSFRLQNSRSPAKHALALTF